MSSSSSSSSQPINMERIRGIFSSTNKDDRDAEYEPLRASGDDDRQDEVPVEAHGMGEAPFSWFEYTIFALVGVAMLWAW